ncbi:hypothetical protein A2U01_0112305, partial [Trifolium medium]|nr:hypothetical protein [Trifolium medium]
WDKARLARIVLRVLHGSLNARLARTSRHDSLCVALTLKLSGLSR